MATVAILGGGISGLSCAYYLKTLGQSKIKYLFLLEKSPKFGGWIQTTRFPDGAIFEHGPRTLRSGTKPGYNAIQLAEQLGLSSRVLAATRKDTSSKSNFILANNELRGVPGKLTSFFFKSPPFSKPLLSYAFNEYRTPKGNFPDESVYDFAQRRIGEDVAKYVFDPLCRGISAGDARELSVRSMFPTLYEAELQHGSVLKSMLNDHKMNPALEFMQSELVQKASSQEWRMWTLKTGLTELIDALACEVEERGKADLAFNASCSGLTFKGNKVEVQVENENIVVDHVFASIPSNDLASLTTSYPILSSALSSIPAVDVAVVYLEFDGDVLKQKGFGYLSPSTEGSNVLGVVFDSCSFPEMNGVSKTRLTCMIGGRWFNAMFGNAENVSEGVLLDIAKEAAKKHLHILEDPVRHKVLVQKQCIPQYIVGHHQTLQTIEEEIDNNKLNLSVIGASYKGAGVPDCIYNTKISVENYLNSF